MNPESFTHLAKSARKSEKPEKSQAELRQILMEKMESLRISTLEQIDIYEDLLEKGDFDDKEGEPEGSGEERKLQMQRKLLGADQRIDKMKARLDSGEELPQEPVLDSESLKLQNQTFLQETFKIWYNEVKSKVEQIPIIIDPKTEDYKARKDDTDPAKFGEYTLNPDTQDIDFENIPESKIFVPDLSSFVGKPLEEVAKHIIDTYSATHHIPGLEYWKWLIENPTKSPVKLKDGKYYFNFGSLVRYSGGYWGVPCADWGGSDWDRDARWLGNSWAAEYRVVLLEI
ncbi:MAG: hypothetical protein WC631_02245 [Candidatus Paceibacterota bacterium]|jgi:hypothetical protein